MSNSLLLTSSLLLNTLISRSDNIWISNGKINQHVTSSPTVLLGSHYSWELTTNPFFSLSEVNRILHFQVKALDTTLDSSTALLAQGENLFYTLHTPSSTSARKCASKRREKSNINTLITQCLTLAVLSLMLWSSCWGRESMFQQIMFYIGLWNIFW